MKVKINDPGHMTKMAAIAKTFKDLFLQNQKAYDFETWHEASGRGALQSFWADLDLLYSKVSIARTCI